MISGVRAGFSASLSGCFCSAMRSLSADDSVHNRRAAALPFASLVVHWASTSLLPALRALGFALPGAEKRRTAAFFLSVRNRRAAAFSLASLVAHWASASLHHPLGALRLRPLLVGESDDCGFHRFPSFFVFLRIKKAPVENRRCLLCAM